MAVAEHHHEEHEEALSPAQQLKNNRMALWMFCFSEIFLFGGLLAARFNLWQVDGHITRPDLNQTIGFIVTAMLLVSSFYMNRAEEAIAHDDRKTFLNGLLTTAALGTIFFIGVVIFEWGGHIKPWDGVYGAVLFGMTGIHAIHVVTGVIFIMIVWNNGRNGHYSAENHWAVEACAIYWHFVDVVWVFFYPALYLIGQVVVVGGH